MHAERWRHLNGCGRFFNALRDTTNDRFAATYKIGEERPMLLTPKGRPKRRHRGRARASRAREA